MKKKGGVLSCACNCACVFTSMMLPAKTAVDILLSGVLMIEFNISSAFYHKPTPEYNLNHSETQLNNDS